MQQMVYSTCTVPPPDRAEYWHEVAGRIFVRQEMEYPTAGTEDFSGKIVQHSGGPLNVAEVVADAHRTFRTRELISRDSEDYVLVFLQAEGSAIVSQNGRSALLTPGCSVLCDATRPYILTLQSAIHHVVLKLPYARVRAMTGGLESIVAVAALPSSGVARLLWRTATTLRDVADEIEPEACSAIADSLVDMTAATFAANPARDATVPRSLERHHRERLRAFVLDNLQDAELCVDRICKAIELSPRYVHRLFAAEGQTLMRWVWHERLEACRKELSNPANRKQPISSIAFRWGFNDAAHFTRMFSRSHGVPPGEYRKAVNA